MRAEALRDGQTQILELIATGAPLEDVLTGLVRLVEAQTEAAICSISLVDEKQGRLRYAACPTLPQSFREATDNSRIEPSSDWRGVAAYRREPVIIGDIQEEPQWAEWRELALRNGLRACWASPIMSHEGSVLGTFTMYYRDPRVPREAESRLIHTALHIAGIAIERKRGEEALRETSQELQQLMASIPDYLISVDVSPEGKFTHRYLSPVVEKITGRPPEFYRQNSPSNFLSTIHPEDVPRIKEDIRKFLSGRISVDEDEYRILLPNGEIRWVHSKMHVTGASSGGVRLDGVVSDVTERKRTEEALRETTEELEQVLSSIADYVWSADVTPEGEYRLRYMSPVVEKMTGRPPEFYKESVPDRWLSTVHPDDRPRLRKAFEEMVRGERIVEDIEHRIKLPDGEIRWVRDSASASAIVGGGLRISGVVSDITERKQAEEALRETAKELEEVMATIPDYLVSMDVSPEGEVKSRYVSPVVEKITGRPPEFYYGGRSAGTWPGRLPENWLRTVHPEDRPRLKRAFEELAAGKLQSHEDEHRIMMPNGEIRWVGASARAIPLEGGRVRISGVVSDITERKRAEEALSQSQQLLQSVIDNSSAIVYVKDIDGRYLLINQRFEDLFDVTSEFALGKTDYDIFPRERADAFRQADQQVFSAGKSIQLEETAPQKDGLHTYISVKSPLVDTAGKIYAICGISTDITEGKRLEEHLRSAQKLEAIGKLAGGIAHDFNNLMTVVTGYSGLLLESLEGDPALREKIEEIHKAGEQAASLTRQLLAFSRRQSLQPKILNLNEVLGRMAIMLRRLVSENIDLAFVTDASLGLIRCDAGQIEQIVMNLIINARDAMPNGGRITVTTANASSETDPQLGKAPGDYVRLTVTDTGFGMDEETKAHIFEPFFTTKGQGKGTGLGLATVYGVVQQAEGRIAVESAPERGTRFDIFLPRVQEEEVPEMPAQVSAPARGTETILVAEDQEGLRTLVSEILRTGGYQVLPARNGQDALRISDQHRERLDLLVTDLIMPKMGGRDLAEAMPVLHPETKILFMSGYFDDPGESLTPGHDFIEKPFSPETLLRKVREVLDKPTELPHASEEQKASFLSPDGQGMEQEEDCEKNRMFNLPDEE